MLTASTAALAQESPTPSPAARRATLHFVPPPLDGTISLGIYDSQGKLVRVLHREDKISDFTAGADALATTWDGADDKGNPLPPGRYRAHGFLVGAIKIEGVAYFFNDFVTDDTSPHIAHIARIALEKNQLRLSATLADGKPAEILLDPATQKSRVADLNSPAQNPQLNSLAPAFRDAVALAPGRNGTWWAILKLPNEAGHRAVAQLAGGDADVPPNELRRLTISPNDPMPVGIAASVAAEQIFLLEESPQLQRLRSLTLLTTSTPGSSQQATSDWKVDFTKAIVAHGDFALKDGKPVIQTTDQPVAPEKVSQTLRPNPLERDRADRIDLAPGSDESGSYLATADGLPLRTVSDNAHLKRVLIARHDENSVDLFQDDGAVVEQFRLSNLDQMLAFDCGEFELK